MKKLINALLSLILMLVITIVMMEAFVYALDRSPTTLYHAEEGYTPAPFGSVVKTMLRVGR